MTAADPFGLARFVSAQEGVHERALAELAAGRKQTHWMWFIFPQLAALGRSEMAKHYGIGSAAEARAYLAHPVLGSRLAACTRAALGHSGETAEAIFGPVDALKFRSSTTLFEQVAPGEPCFAEALDLFYAGERDPATLALLAGEERPA